MRRRILHSVAEILWFCVLSGLAFAQLQEPLPKLNYDMTADFFQLPPEEHLVEPAGVAADPSGLKLQQEREVLSLIHCHCCRKY